MLRRPILAIAPDGAASDAEHAEPLPATPPLPIPDALSDAGQGDDLGNDSAHEGVESDRNSIEDDHDDGAGDDPPPPPLLLIFGL